MLNDYGERFSKLGSPDWAFDRIAPAIPYIGEDYHTMPARVLVYASTENLATDDVHREWLRSMYDDPQKQLLRSYGVKLRSNEEQNVMIEPSTMAACSWQRDMRFTYGTIRTYDSASAFLKQIAVANASKFSIASDANKDPAHHVKYWPPSKAFIEHDLEVQKPDIVILPRTILWRLKSRKVGLNPGCNGASVLPNYQITSRTTRNINKELDHMQQPVSLDSKVAHWQLSRGAERWAMPAYLKWWSLLQRNGRSRARLQVDQLGANGLHDAPHALRPGTREC